MKKEYEKKKKDLIGGYSAMDSDNDAYAHMREHGIYRTKKNGPRKGQTIHETVGGRLFRKK